MVGLTHSVLVLRVNLSVGICHHEAEGARWLVPVGGQMGGSDFSLRAAAVRRLLLAKCHRPSEELSRGGIWWIDTRGALCVGVFWRGRSQRAL